MKRTITADRTEFIGRNGTLKNPSAMSRSHLSSRVGAALDPCAAIQVPFDLAQGAEREIVFTLGVVVGMKLELIFGVFFGMMGMCVNIEAYCFLHYLKEDYFIPCKHFKVKKITGPGKVSKEEMNKKITMPRFSCAMCALKKLKDCWFYDWPPQARRMSTCLTIWSTLPRR